MKDYLTEQLALLLYFVRVGNSYSVTLISLADLLAFTTWSQ